MYSVKHVFTNLRRATRNYSSVYAVKNMTLIAKFDLQYNNSYFELMSQNMKFMSTVGLCPIKMFDTFKTIPS